jgi:hypothetical protein
MTYVLFEARKGLSKGHGATSTAELPMRSLVPGTTAGVLILGMAMAHAQGGGTGAGSAGAGGGTNGGTSSGTAVPGPESAQDRSQGSGASGASGSGGARGNAAAQVGGTPAGPVMTSDQGRRVTDALKALRVEPAESVDFEIREGVAVLDSATLQNCPEAIGRIVKSLRNCQLMRVRDQILLVAPTTRKIIEVIRVAS